MTAFSESPIREPRRGELNEVLSSTVRHALQTIHTELVDLRDRAASIHDDFLSLLISEAAEEARDQLRDDLILREERAAAAKASAEPAGAAK